MESWPKRSPSACTVPTSTVLVLKSTTAVLPESVMPAMSVRDKNAAPPARRDILKDAGRPVTSTATPLLSLIVKVRQTCSPTLATSCAKIVVYILNPCFDGYGDGPIKDAGGRAGVVIDGGVVRSVVIDGAWIVEILEKRSRRVAAAGNSRRPRADACRPVVLAPDAGNGRAAGRAAGDDGERM